MPFEIPKKVFCKSFEKILKDICKSISQRYEIKFIEIGSDENNVHFFVQSVPFDLISKKIVQSIKSITVFQILKKHPEDKEKLWGFS